MVGLEREWGGGTRIIGDKKGMKSREVGHKDALWGKLEGKVGL